MTLQRFAVIRQGRLPDLWYAPILALAMGLMFIRILIYAKLLEVPAFAVYSASVLVSGGFLMLGCMGFQLLLQREMPVMLMRQRESASVIMLMQCVLIALISAALIIGVVIVTNVTLAGLSPLLVVLSLVHGMSMQIFLVASVESRSRGQTLRFALQNLYRAAIMLLTGSLLAAWCGDPVAVLAIETISTLVVSVLLLRRQFDAVSIGLSTVMALAWGRFSFTIWRPALMLLAVSAISFMIINADRWVAAKVLIPNSFAQYAFAWTVLMIAQSVQLVINSSLFPLLSRRFASRGGEVAFSACNKFSFCLLMLGGIAVWPSYLLLNYSIDRWFANYHESRNLLFIFLVVSVFRVSDFWSSYLVVIGREVELLLLNLFSLAIGFFIWWLYAKSFGGNLGIDEVALLSLILAITVSGFAAWAAWYFKGSQRKVV